MSTLAEIADAVREYEAQIRAIPSPSRPDPLGSAKSVTGSASNSAPHTAPSPAVTHNAPAGASYNGDAS